MYTFDEKTHTHTLDGKKLTGVTTVIGVVSKGDGLIQWSANEAVNFLDNYLKLYKWDELTEKDQQVILNEAKTAWKNSRDTAGDKGKDTHAIVEMIIKYAIKNGKGMINGEWMSIVNILVDSDEKKAQITQFLDWAKDKKFLESERNIYSRELWVGGIVDFVYELNGEVYIGDVKTAKAIYPTNFWQTSAYQYCLQEMGLYPKVKGFTIVRLGKDGSFDVKENFSYDDNIEGFKSALTIYRKLNAITPIKKVRSTVKINKLTTK